MTFVQRVIEALDSGIFKFIKAVFSANHDYPFHDYKKVQNPDEENRQVMQYVVGEGNKDINGNQHKLFVSKRMLIWTYDNDTTIRLNDTNNVEIDLPLKIYTDSENEIMFAIELRTNISKVFISLAAEKNCYVYCEGVLPQETRNPE